ncbi:glutamyl aminopeptidase-like [Dreissena polymorpha]|uniref:Aminopeptidase n=1 Tax=Dreissena polymorpha TaxID=45954 RepID=A0A9D4M0T1_DREPO|nr:glutamyl aminopeptidase-like [Dreissena polymorpha]KAH3868193.1 hypothetical protein DPMN_031333 [Dreissena polymorpha]
MNMQNHANTRLQVSNATRKLSKEEEVAASLSRSVSGTCSVKGRDTIVAIAGDEKGCMFKRNHLFVTVLASAAFVGLLVAFVVFQRPGIVRPPGNTLSYDADTNTFRDCACATELEVKHDDEEDNKYVATDSHNVFSDDSYSVKANPKVSMNPELDIRLPTNIIPRHYNLDLDVYVDEGNYTGSVKIYVNVTSETRYVIFHVKFYMLRLFEEEVYIYKPSDYTNEKDLGKISIGIIRHFDDFDKEIHVIELKTALPVGEHVIYIRKFQGYIFGDLKGIYLSSYKTSTGETRKLVASQLQSTDARKVFPCFDEPAMKATFNVSITHDVKYTALSNMPVIASQCVGDCNRLRDVFQTTPIMSTYLLAFVVSDFRYTERLLDGNYTLRIWSQPDLINLTHYALNFAINSYGYFTDYFQMPDVMIKADHVAVPDFSGAAMENWGLVIYRETALLYDPNVSSSFNKYMVTLIIAHEISHTWFGNMVTMRWWSDLWLNEGFASILMYFSMDHAYPDWNVLEIVVVEDIFPVMVKDALVTSHPVSTNIIHPIEIAESFDQISYNKGMAILRMLETFLGPDGFRLGLQTYVEKYKFDNADHDELWATFSKTTNNTIDIGAIMDTWTRQTGYPVVTIRQLGDFYILEQQRFLMDSHTSGDEPEEISEFGYKWRIPFTYRLEGENNTRLHWLNMGPGKVPRSRDGWIIGNVDYGGFYRVNYDLDMWNRLSEQLNSDHKIFSGANRAGLIGDAFNLARASLLDYGIAFNITTYLSHEQSYVPWKAFLDCLEFIRGMLSKTTAYVLLQKYIGELIEPVLNKVGMDGVGDLPEMYLRRTLLRTGCDVGVKSAVMYAKRCFREWMINGTRPTTDYAQLIYAVGVQEGSVDEWDYVWNQSQSTQSPAEREMLLEALAHTQKPYLLWRYAQWIFDGDKIKLQDVRLVTNYFSSTPLGRMIALHFLMNYWDDLNDKFGADTFIISEMIGEVTQYVNSEFELRQLELLFKEKPPKGAKQGADNALALIRANINWMDSNYHAISSWLQEHVPSSF